MKRLSAWGGCLPGGVCPGGVVLRGGVVLGGGVVIEGVLSLGCVVLGGVVLDVGTPQTRKAGGMHPTGMLSCTLYEKAGTFLRSREIWRPLKHYCKQECIPVGCVPSAAVGGGVCLGGVCPSAC